MPDEVLNEAHEGLFWIEKVRAVALAAFVLGLNEYAVPAVTCVGGLPEIVRAAATLIEKAASEALLVPSLTLMTIFEYVPALAAAGVPESWPLAAAEGRPGGLVLDAERQAARRRGC